MRLTSPVGGEQWSVDSEHYITWEFEDAPLQAEVTVSIHTGDGGWRHIAGNAPNEGKFLWRVPKTLSDACRARVEVIGLDLSAQSDAPFAIVPSQQVSGYRWEEVTPVAEFAWRDGAGALTHDGRMWLLGGWNPRDQEHFPRTCNNEVWNSADGKAWTLVKPNTYLDDSFDPDSDWEGRHCAGYAVHRGRMWIVGGDGNQGHYMADVWASADGKRWTQVNKGKPVPWGPRELHHTVAFKDRLWIMGGQTCPQFAPAKEAFYRDIWASADGIEWTRIEPEEPFWPQRGMIGGSAVFEDRMWILGGGTYDTPAVKQRKYFNDVWSSDDGVHWTQHVSQAPWAPRLYHDVAVFDGRMWVMEGSLRANRNDVWYSADGVNWYELPETPWAPRHAASVFVHDGALWMVAGNNLESDVWKLVKDEAGPR